MSMSEMISTDVINILDKLYATYSEIKACTKSCLFTSVNEEYSFTDIREEQKNTEPAKAKFDMSLKIKKDDAKDIFKTTNPEIIEGEIRNLFIYPSELKERMSYQIDEEQEDYISIKWKSDMAISSLDKTIATNHIFAKYDKLLESDRDILFEMNYGGQTTNLIDEQHRIESEENKRLIEYDMSTITLGKREYNKLNDNLKSQLEYFGLERIQESGWISKKGMTDEQIQAVLTELFRRDCCYDKITEVMDVSVVNEIYDYMKVRDEQNNTASNPSSDETSGQIGTADNKGMHDLLDRFANVCLQQTFNDTAQRDAKDDTDFDF